VVGLKELEYFASGTPVLHFGEPLEELAPLLGECPQVRVVRTVAEAEAAFAELSSSRHRGRVNAPALAGFTWRAQAPRLAQVLDRAVRASGGG
jgi:hypothetical protein